jgi:hypothetical protein
MIKKILTVSFIMLLFAITLISLIPNEVEAATTADIVVTAYGYICGSPSGLVISYTGEDYVDIDWVKGVGAQNTMIRVGHTGYPTSLTDGGLVYTGNGTHTQYVINYERLLTNEEYEGLYFIAWSQRADGVWETIGATTGASSFWQDVNMLFLIVCAIVLTLTFYAFKLKNIGLSVVSAFGWAGLGIQQLNLYYTFASITGLEPLIGYTCALMCICMFIAPIMWVRKPKVVMETANNGILNDVLDDPDMTGIMRSREAMRNMRRSRQPRRR